MARRYRAFPDLRERLRTAKPIVLYAATFSPSLTSAPKLAEAIGRLSKLEKWHWLVTMHPKLDPAIVDKYRALEGPHLSYFSSSEGVLPLLKTADVMLCDTSSIALEFMLLDKPTVTFRTRVSGPHALNVEEPAEIEQAIERALTRPELLMRATRAYINRLHPYQDGVSSQRVLEATDRFIESHARKLKPKPLNLWRKFQMRREMHYYRLR